MPHHVERSGTDARAFPRRQKPAPQRRRQRGPWQEAPAALREGSPQRSPWRDLFDTYLVGLDQAVAAPAWASLAVGTHLPLRLSHRRLAGTAFLFKVEVCDPDGRPLGCLPPADSREVTRLLADGTRASARILAIAPGGFGRGERIQLAVEAEIRAEAPMPYASNLDLPDSLRHVLPDHAQDIYRAAFNSAWQAHDGGAEEATCHRIAWAAVKKRYVKRGGFWVPRP